MSWPVVELGSLFEFIRNGMNVKQNSEAGGLPITRIETISDGTVNPARVGYAGLRVDDVERWLLESGDILFSHINSFEHVGKCAVYRGAPETLVHGMNLLCFRADRSKLDPEYAKHLLRSRGFRTQLERFINKAVNQASVSIGNLSSIPIALPPLDEQQRIAAILDQAEELRAKRRAAIALLDQLPQAIFLEMFGDPGTNPKGWVTKSLKEVTTKIGSGSTPTGGESAYKTSGIALIRSMNIHDGQFVPKGLAYIDEIQAAKLGNVVVAPNDVLLNITGASVARVALVPNSVLPARVNQHVSILRCAQGLSPRFLESLLINPSTKKKLLRVAGAGATREAITKEQLESFEIPLPPIETQELFSGRVERVFRAKSAHQTALKELDNIFSSLQSQSFGGTK